MAREKEPQKSTGEILHDFFNSLGTPAEVAKEIDDIIFDWIGSNDQSLQDWHKNKIYTLKCVRDLFTDLNALID